MFSQLQQQQKSECSFMCGEKRKQNLKIPTESIIGLP